MAGDNSPVAPERDFRVLQGCVLAAQDDQRVGNAAGSAEPVSADSLDIKFGSRQVGGLGDGMGPMVPPRRAEPFQGLRPLSREFSGHTQSQPVPGRWVQLHDRGALPVCATALTAPTRKHFGKISWRKRRNPASPTARRKHQSRRQPFHVMRPQGSIFSPTIPVFSPA